MIQLRQLNASHTRAKILEVFGAAQGGPILSKTTLKSLKLTIKSYRSCILKLDKEGAFIPAEALEAGISTMAELATASSAHQVTFISNPGPKVRIRIALAAAGSVPAASIKPEMTLGQLGVSADWTSYVNQQFRSEGVRMFPRLVWQGYTAAAVYTEVRDLIEAKVIH